jgi:hypothetical protein
MGVLLTSQTLLLTIVPGSINRRCKYYISVERRRRISVFFQTEVPKLRRSMGSDATGTLGCDYDPNSSNISNLWTTA